MCRLIESIRLSHSKLENLSYHEARMNQARAVLFGCKVPLKLPSQIQIPESLDEKVYKCRVLYKEEIEQIEFVPYQVKPICSLKLVECNTINYTYKYENREIFSSLMAHRGDCDDILIVKNGYITDTSYCNIAFFDENRWVTPSTPLLAGTQRQKLLDKGIIHEQEIRVDDLQKFTHARLMNALMGFSDTKVPVSHII